MDIIYQGNDGFDLYTRNNRAEKRRRTRRINIIKKSIIFSLTLVVALFGLMFLAFSGNDRTYASEEKVYEYYKTVTVNSGDTLWSIADEYSYGNYDSVNDRIEELVRLNNLKGTEIHAGEKIVVKYYSPEKL
ncbi:MAG: LysM peptidoglycan-binding domain-containing protein [Lachnospiraceae bacterium]|nr:LysM peptidoglycan-binding domain-containing protein [Lachnospiraceae bacterium]